jgi:hypothetical protein
MTNRPIVHMAAIILLVAVVFIRHRQDRIPAGKKFIPRQRLKLGLTHMTPPGTLHVGFKARQNRLCPAPAPNARILSAASRLSTRRIDESRCRLLRR